MKKFQVYDWLQADKDTNLWSYVSLKSVDVNVSAVKPELERKLLESTVEVSKESLVSVKSTILQRFDKLQRGLSRLGFEVRVVEARLLSRALFGTGFPFGRVAFEVGLCFDPLLNVPFLPASSIKGAVRAAYVDIVREREGLSDGEAEQKAELIFGSSDAEKAHAGLVGFTDAYPVEAGEGGCLLYPDVLTPHYAREDVETELDVKPNPVVYLAVAPGVKFRLYLYSAGARGDFRLSGKDMAEDPSEAAQRSPSAEALLRELGFVDLAVLQAFGLGVGGKTMLGYSRFAITTYERVSEPRHER